MSFKDGNSSNRASSRGKAKECSKVFENTLTASNSSQHGKATLGIGADAVTAKDRFRKSITEKEVNIKFFILEGIRGFNDMDIREKISLVLQRCDSGCQEYIFDKIGSGLEIMDYATLKTVLREYCINGSIEQIQKYKDESWSSYIKRLRLEATNRGLQEEQVVHKLRGMATPKQFQPIIYTPGLEISQIIETIEQWETTYGGRKQEAVEGDLNFKKRTVRCYKCGQLGHKRFECGNRSCWVVSEIRPIK